MGCVVCSVWACVHGAVHCSLFFVFLGGKLSRPLCHTRSLRSLRDGRHTNRPFPILPSLGTTSTGTPRASPASFYLARPPSISPMSRAAIDRPPPTTPFQQIEAGGLAFVTFVRIGAACQWMSLDCLAVVLSRRIPAGQHMAETPLFMHPLANHAAVRSLRRPIGHCPIDSGLPLPHGRE